MHIIWASKDKRMCFYMDNTLTDPGIGTVDPQVCLLRQMTEMVPHKVAQCHKLPLTWLKFEQEVRDLKVLDRTKKTVSVEELLELKIWYSEISDVSHGVTCCGAIHDSVCVTFVSSWRYCLNHRGTL